MNNDLLKMLVGSAVRHGLTALSAYLISQNMLAPEHVDGFVNNIGMYLTDALPGLLSLGWSFIMKYEHHEALKY